MGCGRCEEGKGGGEGVRGVGWGLGIVVVFRIWESRYFSPVVFSLAKKQNLQPQSFISLVQPSSHPLNSSIHTAPILIPIPHIHPPYPLTYLHPHPSLSVPRLPTPSCTSQSTTSMRARIYIPPRGSTRNGNKKGIRVSSEGGCRIYYL